MDKSTLLVVGIGAIATGIPTIKEDLVTGLVLVAVGMAVIYFREYMKLK
jgi:hypothetical protein